MFRSHVAVRCVGKVILSTDEREAILASKTDAIRRLTLKTIGYNRSKGQSGHGQFDRAEFALRAWRVLPAQDIAAAVERNDCNYFIALGKKLAKLRSVHPDDLFTNDPLGKFLIANWTQRPRSAVPWFACLSATVLAEVCIHTLQSGSVTSGQIELAVHRLGLVRASMPLLVKCGRYRHGLYVANNVRVLKRFAKEQGIKIAMLV